MSRPTPFQYWATFLQLLLRLTFLAGLNLFCLRKLTNSQAMDVGFFEFAVFEGICAVALVLLLARLKKAVWHSKRQTQSVIQVIWQNEIERVRIQLEGKRSHWTKLQRIRAWLYVALFGMGTLVAQIDLGWNAEGVWMVLPYLLIAVGFVEILKISTYQEIRSSP